MTDQEITLFVQKTASHLAEQFTNKMGALMAVVRILQSQPGYDHHRFVSMLAALQAAHEAFGWDSESARQTYEDIFLYFTKEPLPLADEASISFVSTPGNA